MGLFRKIRAKFNVERVVADLMDVGIAKDEVKTYLNVARKEEKEGEIAKQAQKAIQREDKNIEQLRAEIGKEHENHPIRSRIRLLSKRMRNLKRQMRNANARKKHAEKVESIASKNQNKYSKKKKVYEKWLRNVWSTSKHEIKLIQEYKEKKDLLPEQEKLLIKKAIKEYLENGIISGEMSAKELTARIDKAIKFKQTDNKNKQKSQEDNSNKNKKSDFKENVKYDYKTKADYVSQTISSLGELSKDAAKQPNRIQLAYIGHIIQAMEAGASFTHDDLLKNTIEYEKNDKGLNDVASKRADEELGKSLKDIRDEIDTYTQKIEEAKNNNQEYAEMEHSKEALECIFTIAKKYKDIEKMDKVKKQQQKQQQQNKSQGQQQAV